MKALAGAAVLLLVCGLLTFALGAKGDVQISKFSTDLKARTASQRHNAAISARYLDGCVLAPGETFSFNARVGSFSRDRGFRKAPVSYNGQLIDSWGGGVCQTSTTLYNAALLAGLEVVERHRHRFAPSYVGPGRDAAVAFDSIDLKFRNIHPFPISIRTMVDRDNVIVEIRGDHALALQPEVVSEIRDIHRASVARINSQDGVRRIRNSGKDGVDVVVYRSTGERKELISADTYPSMDRVLATRTPSRP